jgi:hypothetical protein
MLDRSHLLAVEAAAAGEHEDDRGARILPLTAEQLAARQYQMHARLLHRGDRADGARQLALERAHVVDVLNEVGGTEALGAIEDFVADGGAARQTFLGHHHARAPDLVLRHEDLAAFLTDPVGDVHLLEAGDDLAAVLRAEFAV